MAHPQIKDLNLIGHKFRTNKAKAKILVAEEILGTA